ncbi:helix-turn-helix domain-containing protein [Amycolatopsis sp. MtRt-6]|uniref:helix-turn-helix domain-containing protein n=1 Tax=Amycolatopsis sp. MtRt-6 TaxID=2792782 RepID=UPI001A909E89|nr:XRE family transcriptional regulator [Amycolatopsis sp. MtRt-6]
MHSLGSQLKTLRTRHGMSLRDLAARSGVSATMLSQVERGVTEPSLSTLRRLAEVFGESVASLFDSSPPAVWISRPGTRSTLAGPRGLVRYERLTPGNGQLEVLRAVLPPGTATSEEPWAHASTECAYVVAGTLTVQIGDATHEVLAGESITFDSNRPHLYRNSTGSPVEYLVSITPPSP